MFLVFVASAGLPLNPKYSYSCKTDIRDNMAVWKSSSFSCQIPTLSSERYSAKSSYGLHFGVATGKTQSLIKLALSSEPLNFQLQFLTQCNPRANNR